MKYITLLLIAIVALVQGQNIIVARSYTNTASGCSDDSKLAQAQPVAESDVDYVGICIRANETIGQPKDRITICQNTLVQYQACTSSDGSCSGCTGAVTLQCYPPQTGDSFYTSFSCGSRLQLGQEYALAPGRFVTANYSSTGCSVGNTVYFVTYYSACVSDGTRSYQYSCSGNNGVRKDCADTQCSVSCNSATITASCTDGDGTSYSQQCNDGSSSDSDTTDASSGDDSTSASSGSASSASGSSASSGSASSASGSSASSGSASSASGSSASSDSGDSEDASTNSASSANGSASSGSASSASASSGSATPPPAAATTNSAGMICLSIATVAVALLI